MPKLSIIVVVYNLEKYVRECLDSILRQDFKDYEKDYEVILVDNSSTDSSREICREYALRYPQIRFIPLEGKNIPGRAHSVGVAEAKGEYLHLIDGDDFVADGCYKDIMKIIDEKAPDMIMGSFICAPEEGAKNMNDAIIDADRINGRTYEEAIKYLMELPNFHMPHWRYVCKKKVLLEEQVSKESVCVLYSKVNMINYHGDIVTTVKMLCNADSLYYYDKPFYYYRMRNRGSISSNNSFGHYRGYFLVIFRLIGLLMDRGYDGIRQELIFRIIRNTFQLFSSGIGIMNDNDIEEIAEIINNNLDGLNILNKIRDKDIEEFCKHIESNEAHKGIREYFNYKKEKIISLVNSKRKDKIFVFPSGRYGEFVARILIENGINVVGFLDNDSYKHGKTIMGLDCHLPSALDKNDMSSSNFVIATIYNSLKPVLKKQLSDMGISEKYIIVDE